MLNRRLLYRRLDRLGVLGYRLLSPRRRLCRCLRLLGYLSYWWLDGRLLHWRLDWYLLHRLLYGHLLDGWLHGSLRHVLNRRATPSPAAQSTAPSAASRQLSAPGTVASPATCTRRCARRAGEGVCRPRQHRQG